jgi:hypothetical protein
MTATAPVVTMHAAILGFRSLLYFARSDALEGQGSVGEDNLIPLTKMYHRTDFFLAESRSKRQNKGHSGFYGGVLYACNPCVETELRAPLKLTRTANRNEISNGRVHFKL